jgi:hypothetical protein
MHSRLADKHRTHLETLRRCLGLRLNALTRSRYLFNGTPDGIGHGDLELRFQGGRSVVLTTESDGESVAAEERVLTLPEAFTLESGSTCAWDTVDLSGDDSYRVLLGAALDRIDAVIGHYRGVDHSAIVGWSFHFGDRVLTFMNQGDESWIGRDLPRSDAYVEIVLEEVSPRDGAGQQPYGANGS